jgi:hypothetical protein
MARGIQNFPNVTAPDSDYLDGNVKDAPNGTPVNKLTMSDIWQFFAKMMREAGVSFNNLPDNETNGYQLYESLNASARPYKCYCATVTQSGTNDPVADIHENQLSGDPTFARSGAGTYSITLTGEFTAGKVAVFAHCETANRTAKLSNVSVDGFVFSVLDNSFAGADGSKTNIEIRVYR